MVDLIRFLDNRVDKMHVSIRYNIVESITRSTSVLRPQNNRNRKEKELRNLGFVAVACCLFPQVRLLYKKYKDASR